MRDTKGRFSFGYWVLSVVCLALLSACADDPNIVGRANNPDKILVPAPSFEVSEELNAAITPIKVTKIDVVAPKQGKHILDQRLSVSIRNGARYRFAAIHFLKEDFEPVVRKALAQLYEIDPESDNSISVELSLDVRSRLSDDWLCKSWITNTKIEMIVTTNSIQTDSTDETYSGSGENTFCPFSTNFSTPEAVDEAITAAFQQAIDEMLVKNSPAARASKTANLSD